MSTDKHSLAHWRGSLRIVAGILLVWSLLSFGCSILFKEALDKVQVGNAPLGFWMSQQGSIIGFVSLLIIYTVLMNRLDHEHDYDDEEVASEQEDKA